MTPIVVYHAAAMGNWREVVAEQMSLLDRCGLAAELRAVGDALRLSHVGPDLDQVLAIAAANRVPVLTIRTDPNTDHYETFAMTEIDRLAKVERITRPILYWHTKGVSAPGYPGKAAWRKLMQEHVVNRWRTNMPHLADHDAVGVNWHQHGEQHFSGTFWMANPDWLRRLPDFAGYHRAKGLVRYSCEMWIGAQQWCRAKSLVCSDQPFWDPAYNFAQWEGA